MPSLIGLGIASPTEVPHLTRVPSNSTDIYEFTWIRYINLNLYFHIDLNIDVNYSILWK